MRVRPRRLLAVLLLFVWTLQACHRPVPVAEPTPDQEMATIVLRSGQQIELSSHLESAVEDSSVVVRDSKTDVVVADYGFDEIDHVVVREFDVLRTVAFGGLVATLGLVFMWMLAMSQLTIE